MTGLIGMLKCAFGTVFSTRTDSRIPTILARGNVGYLSASCCNPAAVPDDERLVANVKAAMQDLSLDLEIHKETLTHAQAGMRSAKARLSPEQMAVVNKVTSLFATRGLDAFPMLFVDGDLAFYGGLPSAAEIAEHMSGRLKGGADPSERATAPVAEAAPRL
jgi:hypothetical protein